MTLKAIRNDCRLCNKINLRQILKLEDSPLANEFVTENQRGKNQQTFPLGLWICESCKHVQLPIVIDPERLFRNYVYVSGTSPVFVDHFRRYADAMIRKFELQKDDLVIDIGSNDGTLLRHFKSAGTKVLGVDPASDIAKKATDEGIKTIPKFFSYQLSEKILKDFGPAQLITANNVFAHADDLGDIVRGVKNLLTPKGVFSFEISYLVDVLDHTLFDTIYHEHLSYHHLSPLILFFKRYGMKVIDAERIDTHGGSLRVYVKNGEDSSEASANVRQIIQNEYKMNLAVDSDPFNGYDPLFNFENKINKLRDDLIWKLMEIKQNNKTIAGFGAPAKSTTLLHHFRLGAETLDFIIDDAPLKQGMFSPGKHLPVLSSKALYEKKPDYVVILAWNFAESIIQKHKSFLEEGGKFIVPIPEVKEHAITIGH